MKKYSLYILLLTLLGYSSCQDDDLDPDFRGVSAEVGNKFLEIEQGDVNYAKVNGNMQIHASLITEEGFIFYLGADPVAGSFDLNASAMNIVYTKDAGTSYQIRTGILEIYNYSEPPLKFRADFSGWAFNNVDQEDSIFIAGGEVNLSF